MQKKKSLRTQKKDWTRNMIQATAKELFFEKGYANCTIGDISESVGMSKGLLYSYFKNKDDLYLSLMRPVLNEIKRTAEVFKGDVIAGKYKTGREVVMAFCKRYQDLYTFNREGIRIVQAYQQGDSIYSMPDEYRKELDRLTRENFEFAVGIVEACIERGLLPNKNPRLLMEVFWGIFIGMIQIDESRYRATRNNHIMEMLELSFTAICDGIFPKSPEKE